MIAILSSSGQQMVSYSYDAWGNVLSATGMMSRDLGALNPLRYRGYVYDSETKLYYLQSRYYNPEIGRFINADNFLTTGQGVIGNNSFAYCLNNPALYADVKGTIAITAAVGGAAAGSVQVLLPAVAIIGFLYIITRPVVQETIARGCETISTTISNWFDELQNTITDRMAASLASTNNNRPDTYHIHHIVAQSDPRAAQSRYIMEYLFEHGVNSAINLVSVSSRVHYRLHTNAYFTLVEGIIVNAFLAAGPNLQDQRNSVTNALLWLRGFIEALSLI